MLFTGGPKKGYSSQWGSLQSCFITDTDKTNLLHECWDMIINVLINECVTFKDINELCSGWFMWSDYSWLLSEAPHCSFHQMGRLRGSSFHLTLVLFAASHHRGRPATLTYGDALTPTWRTFPCNRKYSFWQVVGVKFLSVSGFLLTH